MQTRKKGFTLVELMVVLALIAIISSITFGAFRSISDGNKRTSCQSNLGQIYKSVRLYSQDFDGKFPYLNPVEPKNPPLPVATTLTATDYIADVGAATPAGGIGLWSLYTFRNDNIDSICPNNDVNLPIADDGTAFGLSGYVRSPKIFHCPADRFEKVIQHRVDPGVAACVATPNPVINAQISFTDNLGNKRLNPAYLSYQGNDDTLPIAPSTTPPVTYSSFRQAETTNRVRQLASFTVIAGANEIVERPIDQATVVTWCRFHRSLNDDSTTRSGRRNFDNVLFSDGTVQSLPIEQAVTNQQGVSGNCTGWKRVRREKAVNMTNPVDCTP